MFCTPLLFDLLHHDNALPAVFVDAFFVLSTTKRRQGLETPAVRFPRPSLGDIQGPHCVDATTLLLYESE